MKINGKTINHKWFAYDGCHKIYLCATKDDVTEAVRMGYKMRFIESLPITWERSCPLRFISSWDLNEQYVKQGEQAVFE